MKRKQFKREDIRTRGEKIADALLFVGAMVVSNLYFFYILMQFNK